jgi:ABC-2 type transport system ATP-binding protein
MHHDLGGRPVSALVQATNLSKFYAEVVGLNDVTFTLQPGISGLLGPNGSGKSTFMKLITGQLRPSGGTLEVFGERAWNNPQLFHRIGFCPEQDSLYNHLSGFDFVRYMLGLHGVPDWLARETAAECLEQLNMKDAMHRRIGTYSRGMRQRTKIAQAMALDPDLLILDEPLNGMDPVGRRMIMDTVRRLGDEGKSILVSSHILHEVEELADQFLFLNNGRIIASGSVNEIRDLLDQHPHRIQIQCDNWNSLARALIKAELISGIEWQEKHNSLTVLSADPQQFYRQLPAIAIEADVAIHEMHSEDDSLAAVLKYLLGEGTG